MGKFAEVKKILRNTTVSWYREDKMAWIDFVAHQICQLFEPEPALPLTQALKDIKEAEYQNESGRQAGIREVAEWVEANHWKSELGGVIHIANREWQLKLKEWRI